MIRQNKRMLVSFLTIVVYFFVVHRKSFLMALVFLLFLQSLNAGVIASLQKVKRFF